MVSEQDKEILINYRLQRAYETAEDARIALDNNRFLMLKIEFIMPYFTPFQP